jgi:hypothetical protein
MNRKTQQILGRLERVAILSEDGKSVDTQPYVKKFIFKAFMYK